MVVDVSEIVWRKATRSDNLGGNCVEVAALPGVVAVRDSKDPQGPSLMVSWEAFRTFAASLKN
ncbi:DUF397 domain-containing protein [Actinomadura rugatobispora]|uniref:DUF397 domain-containing protein n=1 Tax=Actinomadura rugatobispora TaxID=1994 RepID=A0ABW1A5T7_9ACTN